MFDFRTEKNISALIFTSSILLYVMLENLTCVEVESTEVIFSKSKDRFNVIIGCGWRYDTPEADFDIWVNEWIYTRKIRTKPGWIISGEFTRFSFENN